MGDGRTDTASRVVAASPDTLYRAFSTAESLMAWLPPGGMTGRALEYDFRQGGRYRIELTYQAARAGVGKTTARSDVSAGAENVPPGISEADHAEGLRASLENLARHVGRSEPLR